MSKKFDITIGVRYYSKLSNTLKKVYGTSLNNRIRLLLDSMIDKNNNEININKLDFQQRLINEDIKEYNHDITQLKKKINHLELKIQSIKKEIDILEDKSSQLEEVKTLLIELNNNFTDNQIDNFKNILEAYKNDILKDNLLDYIPTGANSSSFLSEFTIYLSIHKNKKVVGVSLTEERIKEIVTIIKKGMI